MNGIKGWTILALTMASLLVLAGCSGGGKAKGTLSVSNSDDDDDDSASGSAGARGGGSPGFEAVLLMTGIGVAGAWTAHRLRPKS